MRMKFQAFSAISQKSFIVICHIVKKFFNRDGLDDDLYHLKKLC